VKVVANETVKPVDARVNGGPWVSMKHESYGDWTVSLHAPAGSKVEFRATGASGATAISQAYTWPQ
jgi:hypothetical protein